MKETGIIYCGESVRATLAKIKTQTRRTRGLEKYNQEPDAWEISIDPITGIAAASFRKNKPEFFKCPYGKISDRLWVKEAWRCTGGGGDRRIIYKAEGDTAISFCGINDNRESQTIVPEKYWDYWDKLVYESKLGCRWRSPLHMPKWAARLWLEITGIKVERVQDMSNRDWIKDFCPSLFEQEKALETFVGTKNQKEMAQKLWDSLNAKRGYSWDSNPWCWPISYKILKQGC